MMHWNLQQKLPALLLAHLTDKQNQVGIRQAFAAAFTFIITVATMKSRLV